MSYGVDHGMLGFDQNPPLKDSDQETLSLCGSVRDNRTLLGLISSHFFKGGCDSPIREFVYVPIALHLGVLPPGVKIGHVL